MFLIETGKFIKRMEFYALIGTVTSVLGIILPLIPGENLNAFFRFNSVFELVRYVALIISFLFVLVIASQIIGSTLVYWGRNLKLKVDISEYLQIDSTDPHFSLKVTNREKEDLTDCMATLEAAEQYYTPTVQLDILESVNPNKSAMSWGGGSKSDYVTIPGDKGGKVLNIAHSVNAGQLIFLFHDWQSKPQLANVKYRVSIKINGKIDGESFRAIRYRGCFRTRNYITPVTPVTSYWEGEKGEHIGERSVVYGGQPDTILEFVKCDAEEDIKAT